MNDTQDIEYNLLVIDDEKEVTKAIFRQFRREYNVYTANNADEALSIMESKHIQVVISDQRMPGMTGVDFFSKIKEKYPEALKLLLTGYSDIEAVIGAINEGQVFRYITKPWIPDELSSIVKEAFEKYELITKNKQLMVKLEKANASLEEKVKERTKRLSELNEQKNKYIGVVAHDLRSPIGVAKSFSELLLSEYDLFNKKQHLNYIEIINNRCKYSLELMSNFLDISKIEAGIFDMKFGVYDYIGFIKSTIQLNETFAKQKSQNINLVTELEEFEITFDKGKIEQVITNLISNAIKYSERNTEITIEILIKNDKLITKVSDEGVGIIKEEILNIFNAYHTTSSKSTENEKATGLGLAIVKKLVEAHKGTIDVESKIGLGSTFIVSLPI